MCIECLLDPTRTLYIHKDLKINPKIYILIAIHHMKKQILIDVKLLAQGGRSRGLGYV